MKPLSYYIPLIAAAVVYVIRMVEIKTKRETIPGEIREHLTFTLFLLIGTSMTIGSVSEYIMRGGGFSWVALGAGIACAAASFCLRWRAIAALGKFWSLHIEIREGHQFVDFGPFRIVRHPTYVSMILELLSFGLICNAWTMLCIIPFAFVPVLILRLRLEENAMIEKFGSTYRDYQRRVPMLIPNRWSFAK
ncbi:MAG: isoprenylcysteine carboxylmethyltransferase family protein [Chthoniobacteraceae bacterium]|nr:isoprenylcysteine carboxylmethyltransferase family protein [Chthoniobacteraceae bacterium]